MTPEYQVSSAKQILNHARRLLKAGPRSLKGTSDERLLLRVLEEHPNYSEKKGPGIDCLYVAPKCGDMAFWVYRRDGSRDSFSVKKCLYGESCARLPVSDIMRSEILAQTQAAKREGLARGDRCGLSGRPLGQDTVDIHHDGVEFKDILAAFFKEAGVDRASVQIINMPEGRPVLRDRALRQRWWDYHAAHARLMLVHKDEHRAYHAAKNGGSRA